MAPFWLRADAKKGLSVGSDGDWFSAPRLSARVRQGAGPEAVWHRKFYRQVLPNLEATSRLYLRLFQKMEKEEDDQHIL